MARSVAELLTQMIGGVVVVGVGLAIGWRVHTGPADVAAGPVANWNPMSALAATSRHLFGNPNPAAAVHAWPMQHPELAVVAWSAAMLLVFAPLAVRLYRRKAVG